MQEFSTPMMKQYMEIKRKYPDCLLFFRMGDFYELFLEDAYVGSQLLNITLTGKSGGKDGKIPMAGVPYHAADTYIAKLVKAGHKVAICEQLSPPNKKGLVKRGVVRIVTPGTLLDEKNLEKKDHNYIISLVKTHDTIALAVSELSTGYFSLFEDEISETETLLQNELQRLSPTECILPDDLYNDAEFLKRLTHCSGMNIFPYKKFESDVLTAANILKKHFGITTLEGFGIAEKKTAHVAGASLLTYLKETQNRPLAHIKKISLLKDTDGLELDRSTMINLELFSTIREHDTKNSLLSVLDQTITAMGGRMLKTWMKKPLSEKERIEERLESVNAFSTNPELRDLIREQLKEIPDIERLLARLSVNLGNARDMLQLKYALLAVLNTKEKLREIPTLLIEKERKQISPTLQQAADIIERVFVTDPPFSNREGGMIQKGVHSQLDSLRDAISQSKSWLAELEKSERKKTGITSLKVRFNKVFGYYIEISNANLHLIPDNYIRKQTLVNAERFITVELKTHEEKILTAEEKINELEYKIFSETINEILSYTESIQKGAESIATIDCLATFSLVSEKYRYVKPKLLYSGEIRIKEGRHPVVERLTSDTPFVPNDVTLDNVTQSQLLITGPNMAGKSVFIRQVALIIFMAQIGCFVPATSAHLTIVDKIFVRSGAADIITAGLSTFMVEMVETAYILHHATERSLIVMDEIGRGTSTYDGISIAWAVAEYLVTHHDSPPKVLFATHYHELQKLEDLHPGKIKNFHMAVTEKNSEPVFLHTILPGSASHSYGVAVAKLAGVPENVILRANELLTDLESRDTTITRPSVISKNETENDFKQEITIDNEKTPSVHNDLFLEHFIQKELDTVDIASITPLQALNILATLKEKLSLLKKEQHAFIEKD